MNFQQFFYYLGKIATNLGLDECAPKNFATAKCVAKAIADATLGGSGLNEDIEGTSRTLANDTTFTHTATAAQRYIFTSVTSSNGNQSIFINGVDTTVDLTAATVVGFDLQLGDVLTVVDPASGVGAAWVEVIVPLAI
jgi:hypothetical protein